MATFYPNFEYFFTIVKSGRQEVLSELNREINSSTRIVKDFNTSLAIIDKTTRQKISKTIEDLNSTRNQLHITDIYRTLYQITTKYIFFSSAHGAFSTIENVRPQIKSPTTMR